MSAHWQWVGLFLLGMALSLGYFGGLWWTVRRLPRSRHPWLLYGVSTATRLGLLLATLLGIARGGGGGAGLIFCLAGFVIARYAVVRRIGFRRPSLNPGDGGGAADG